MNDEATSLRGRAVPHLGTYTFDTGKTAIIRKLSPFLRDDVAAQLRKEDRKSGKLPLPPMTAGVEGQLEPNESDPDYLEARRQYEVELLGRIQEKLLRIAVRRGIEIDLDQEELSQLRFELDQDGIEIDEKDEKYFYVTRVCVGSELDLQDLYDALFKRALPTREAVEAHKATFQRDLPES